MDILPVLRGFSPNTTNLDVFGIHNVSNGVYGTLDFMTGIICGALRLFMLLERMLKLKVNF